MTPEKKLNLEDELIPIREQIDLLDAQLLDWLELRIGLIKQVGVIKKKYNAPPLSVERENAILERVTREAEGRGIPKSLVIDMWKAIFNAAYIIEEEDHE